MIKNITLCIVVTEQEQDANKLFEVLNDRALEVGDLEIIKNHFYQKYCLHSRDDDATIDANLLKLDDIWNDTVFKESNSKTKNRLISFLTTVYLNFESNIVFKADTKFKSSIKNYLDDKGHSYGYDDICSDFNVYVAIKTILDVFGYTETDEKKKVLEAHTSNNSIVYKTFHLLVALSEFGVLASLTNLIISKFENEKGLSIDDFEDKFKDYIDEIIKNNDSHKEIKTYAFNLWKIAIMAKNSDIPKKVADSVVGQYARGKYVTTTGDVMFSPNYSVEAEEEFKYWINNWSYPKHLVKMKVLFLELCMFKRVDPTTGNECGLSVQEVQMVVNPCAGYLWDAKKIELDHLEAEKPSFYNSSYFMHDDQNTRVNYVNKMIGNFMILDKAVNNNKNNKPLKNAFDYYSPLSSCWLISDIGEMMSNEEYFCEDVPTSEFFEYRSSLLIKFFKGILLQRTYRGGFDIHQY